MSEDDVIYWQDVLESVLAGKLTDLKCPFCYEGSITVTKKERTTRIACAKCNHFIEGRFSNEG